jgi:hypothetical protein
VSGELTLQEPGVVGVDFAEDLLLVIAQAVEILELLVGHFERHGCVRSAGCGCGRA